MYLTFHCTNQNSSTPVLEISTMTWTFLVELRRRAGRKGGRRAGRTIVLFYCKKYIAAPLSQTWKEPIKS